MAETLSPVWMKLYDLVAQNLEPGTVYLPQDIEQALGRPYRRLGAAMNKLRKVLGERHQVGFTHNENGIRILDPDEHLEHFVTRIRKAGTRAMNIANEISGVPRAKLTEHNRERYDHLVEAGSKIAEAGFGVLLSLDKKYTEALPIPGSMETTPEQRAEVGRALNTFGKM